MARRTSSLHFTITPATISPVRHAHCSSYYTAKLRRCKGSHWWISQSMQSAACYLPECRQTTILRLSNMLYICFICLYTPQDHQNFHIVYITHKQHCAIAQRETPMSH